MGDEGSDVPDPMDSLEFLLDDRSRYCEWPIAGPRDPPPAVRHIRDLVLSSYFYADSPEDLELPAAVSTGDVVDPELCDQDLFDDDVVTHYGEHQSLVDFDLLDDGSSPVSNSSAEPQFFPFPDQIVSIPGRNPSEPSPSFHVDAAPIPIEPEAVQGSSARNYGEQIVAYFYAMFQRAVASVFHQFR